MPFHDNIGYAKTYINIMFKIRHKNTKEAIIKNNTIHMVKGAFHSPFKTAMKACGISADYYFKKVKLPTEVEDPESLLPVKPFFQLINIVAINENLPNFGSIVAQTTPWHKITSLAPLIEQSKNLKELLETFCEIASHQSSHGSFSLIDKGSYFHFSYRGSSLIKGDIQMELYRITSMIQLTQLACDAQWRPDAIYLNQPNSSVVNTCSLLNSSKISFSKPDSSITIPVELLQFPVQLDIPEKKTTIKNTDADIVFANSIRNIINTYTLTNNISIEEVANIVDMSVRTLQRRLSDNGLKFNDLLNESMFIHAKEKLKDTQVTIKDIAESLGYSDAAHFTRAFHSWSGTSPTDFRRGLAENK